MEKDEKMGQGMDAASAPAGAGYGPDEEEKLLSSEEAEYDDGDDDEDEDRDETPSARRSGPAKLVTDQGLTGDKYYVSEPWVDSDELDEEEEEDFSGIEVRYDLRPEEAKAAMLAFQKKVLYKKNIFYSIILLILALLYLQAVIRNPDYAMGKALGVLSLLVIGLLWYLPFRHIQQTVKGIGASEDTFTIEISDVGFLIREEGGKYLIRYRTPTVSVVELAEVFVVCVSREKMFAIPKRCVPEGQMEEIKALMKGGLGEKYQVKG
ncbi:MAG: YcxB family protein [Oscillospiraceae bacterium]|jgi:hypothetical protein|nr:YcxB family protein [Oscillospiraceae bacterium]